MQPVSGIFLHVFAGEAGAAARCLMDQFNDSHHLIIYRDRSKTKIYKVRFRLALLGKVCLFGDIVEIAILARNWSDAYWTALGF